MYKRILVPLDGSQMAEMVLPYVTTISARFGAHVVFLHVCQGAESSLFMCQSYVRHIAETVGGRMGGKDITATGMAVTGNVADQILHQATDTRSDLVIMASHGQSGRGAWSLGSVAHKVVAASCVPVLVVRDQLAAEASKWPRTVVVPLDGSALSEVALEHARAMAQGGADLNLLRVCEPPVVLADYPDAVMPDNWDEHLKLAERGAERACKVYLDGLETRLKNDGLAAKTQVLLSSHVADEISRFVNLDSTALVVMSTHGQSGLSLWPYGHVADRVLLASKNPILLIRPPKA